jgi:hypothetical protein
MRSSFYLLLCGEHTTRFSLCRLIRVLSMWCRAASFFSASGAALSQEVPMVKWMSSQPALWTPDTTYIHTCVCFLAALSGSERLKEVKSRGSETEQAMCKKCWHKTGKSSCLSDCTLLPQLLPPHTGYSPYFQRVLIIHICFWSVQDGAG